MTKQTLSRLLKKTSAFFNQEAARLNKASGLGSESIASVAERAAQCYRDVKEHTCPECGHILFSVRCESCDKAGK